MPRRPHRQASSLVTTLLLLGFGLDALAAIPPGDIQRLKLLQRQVLLREPAGRLEKLERFHAWRRKAGHPGGYRLRHPAREAVDGQAVVRSSVAPARIATPARITALPNRLASDPVGEPVGSCQSEVSIASYGDHVVAAWNDGIGVYGSPFPDDTQGFGYSTDGGLTWTDGGVPPNANIGVWASDPVVAVNEKTGAFYYSGLCDQPLNGTNGIGVVKGTFSGNTFSWGTPALAQVFGNGSALLDKEWLAADSLSGNLYLTYSHFVISGGNIVSDQISFLRSTDDGQTWTGLQSLSAPTDAGYVQGSRPAVGPNGEVYVVWHAIGQSSGPNTNSLYGRDFLRIRKSIDGGLNFAPEVTADSVFSNFGSGAPAFNRGMGITFPAIAVDRTTGPNRGRVYLTWNESLNFYNDAFPNPNDPGVSETENNNGASVADLFRPGDVLRGTISVTGNPGDHDYWKWNATQGQTYIFYLDSLDQNLDAAFRVFCSDGITNLAFSQNGSGGQDLLVFAAPTTATYYLRVASYTGTRTGKYRVLTVANGPQPDRARDQRDIFVKSSSNGFTWGPTVRVNDDPGYYDDFLPEVAVDGFGRLFLAHYDWRDSPAICGGGSNVYLYRSGNGGATWTGGTIVTDFTTNWTTTYSTLIPNQGDYIGLFAQDSTVFIAWGDGRNGDPDIYVASTTLSCTAAPVTLIGAQAATDSVVVTWSAPDGTPATLYRKQGSGSYASLGGLVANGANQIVYVDKAVTAGQSYSYRLGVTGFCEQFVGEVTVSVGRLALAIQAVGPNPTLGDVKVWFSLASDAPAMLALYDIAGREVKRIDVGVGTQQPVNLTQGIELRSGMYFVRLSQDGGHKEKRVAVFP